MVLVHSWIVCLIWDIYYGIFFCGMSRLKTMHVKCTGTVWMFPACKLTTTNSNKEIVDLSQVLTLHHHLVRVEEHIWSMKWIKPICSSANIFQSSFMMLLRINQTSSFQNDQIKRLRLTMEVLKIYFDGLTFAIIRFC